MNDKLRALHFAFYDPRIPVKDFFTIEIKRAEVQEQVNQYITYQRDMLVEIEQIVNSLTF